MKIAFEISIGKGKQKMGLSELSKGDQSLIGSVNITDSLLRVQKCKVFDYLSPTSGRKLDIPCSRVEVDRQ
jgi:hypothetical protein